MESFNQLVEIVKTLRGPNGCPWDKEQTHKSLTPYAIEEAHELEEAVLNGDMNNLKEELGDLLFQSLLHAQLASEAGQFTIEDVLQHLNHKMTSRHPHVFGDSSVKDVHGVVLQWEDLKARETSKTGAQKDPLDIPKTFPALLRAHKIGKKTAKLKFDWTHIEDVFAKVEEEMSELKDAVVASHMGTNSTDLQMQNIEEEMGDLLFTLSQLARHLQLDAETALRKGNEKFIRRFREMLKREEDFINLTADQKETLWELVKIPSEEDE